MSTRKLWSAYFVSDPLTATLLIAAMSINALFTIAFLALGQFWEATRTAGLLLLLAWIAMLQMALIEAKAARR